MPSKAVIKMNLVNSCIIVIFAYLIQSANSMPQSENLEPQKSCKCQLWSTCAWAKQLISQIAVLPKSNPQKKVLRRQFRAQVCNKAQRDVWCCRNGEPATGAELKQLSGDGAATTNQPTNTTTTEKCMVKQSGKDGAKERPVVPCQFPFKYDGETFDGCINFILGENGDRVLVKPWCSTKVDESTREHVQGGGFHGDCKNTPQCPDVGGYHPPMKEKVVGAPDEKIVLITGSSLNTELDAQVKMEIIDPKEDTSKVCQSYSYPINADQATGALVGNKMIICGGNEKMPASDEKEETPDPAEQSDDDYYGYSDNNEYDDEESAIAIKSCYSLDKGQWTKLGDLTTPRYGSASVAISNGLWITGGSESGDTLATTEIIRLDGTTEAGPELPEVRQGHCLVAYNGTIYSIGGYDDTFGNNFGNVWKFNEDEGMKYIGDGPSMNYERNSFACGIYHSKYEHDNRPMIVVAGVKDARTGSAITSEYWDFTVPDSVWETTSKPVPFGIFGDAGTFGPQMSKIGDGTELLMTYEKGVYSFNCDDLGPEGTTQCFWSAGNDLKIERQYHVMMTVPSSMVEEC